MTRASGHWVGRISVAGQCLLIVTGMGWAVFERPTPVVTVAWRSGLSDADRLRAERQLHLENAQRSSDAWEYEVWSPREEDIRAIVGHPDVHDTEHIDRNAATIEADAGHGTLRVWWAGPFKGARGRLEFRALFAVSGVVTLLCTLLSSARRPTLLHRLVSHSWCPAPRGQP